MPSRPKNRPKSKRRIQDVTVPGLLALLLVVAVLFILDYWQKRQAGAQPLPGAVPTRSNYTPAPLHQASPTPQAGAIAVYFSDPLSGRNSGGPEEQLVAAIHGAQRSIDVAIYNLSLENVAGALIAAAGRGVTVRVVMESEAMEGPQAARLLDAGIQVEGDQREGLMHDKFTVIDGSEVWSGSMNYTGASAYDDFNNLVRLRSQRAAQDYTVEFEEMFLEGLFGPDGRPATPYPQVTVDGAPVEIYFSPDDGAAEQIIDEVRRARRSIDFMAYSFTSDEIAEAIRQRAATGVAVRGVFDESQVESNQGGEYEAFRKDGFAVRLDGSPGLMHHKVILIDGQVVITGSYNFSRNAEQSNDENVLILHSPALAAQYQAQFETVYQNGK
jgi:phosphatidylserine/phosphatidylglycerophosphate/cardiolipin synthase-like enzyme